MLFPILDQYAGIFDKISLGETLLITVVILSLPPIKKVNLKTIDISYIIFILVCIILSLLSILFQQDIKIIDFISLVFRMVVYAVFIVFLGCLYFDDIKVIKIYEFISLALCIYLITQYIFYYTTNSILPTFIPFLKVKSSLLTYASRDLVYVYEIFFRPSALLSEPAKFTQYILPYLIILLFDNEQKNVTFKAILVTVCLVLSTSFLAILLVGITYVLFIIKSFRESKQHDIISKLLISTVIVLCFIYILTKTSLVSDNIHRIASGLTISTGTSSASLRLIRGWEIFFELPLLNQIIGVGLGNITNFIQSHSISLVYGGGYSYGEYTNTFTYILNCCGVIGILFFMIFMYNVYKNTSVVPRKLLIVMLVMSFGSSFLVTPTWVLFMIFIYRYDYLQRS